MVTVLICVKIVSDKTKPSKRLEKLFDFLGMEGATVEDKSKRFINRI